MWDLMYVEEVEQVRKALNLDNTNFYLLGHSLGGILAMEYAVKYQSKHERNDYLEYDVELS